MTTTFALAGKGGVGKTTIAAMMVKYLTETQDGAVLAIDADPSSNLNMTLGLDLEWTVGDIREDMLAQVKQSLLAGGAAMGALSGGISKREYLDYEIRSAISEGAHFDLIAMGRSEGAGCYCAVNHNLREVIDTISKRYSYVIIDNEAGMEHLSRRTTRDVQHLIIISDASQRGLVAAERIAAFRHELDINIEHAYLVLNNLEGSVPPLLQERIDRLDIPLLATFSPDPQVTDLDMRGQPLVLIEHTSPIYTAVSEVMRQMLA